MDVTMITRDTDRDGWTDAEEERLGLDPRKPDTDGDGIPDGKDICPAYAPRPGDDDEEARILQKAIFAVFGLSGSRDLIFVGEGSRRLQVWGYEGPILYGISADTWHKKHISGTWVGWKVTARTEREATVSIGDWEGTLAAGGQTVTLRKIQGDWYVVKMELGEVS
jgi:hypothetical protein